MIERIGFLIEILSVLLCIHALYGKKFRIDIKNIITIAGDLILMQFISEGQLPAVASILIYFFVFCYCIVEFGINKCELVVNTVLYMVVICVLQIVSWEILKFLNIVRISNAGTGINNLCINSLVLVVILVVFPHIGLHKFSVFMQQKVILLRAILVMGVVFVLYMLLVMKG